jgi:hypothetical protein
MADRFKANPQIAGQVARELDQIRADMGSLGETLSGYDDATGSREVQDALEDFFGDSSDNREKMNKLLERAAGLLDGLAEGATNLDRNLAGSLTSREPSGKGESAPAAPVAQAAAPKPMQPAGGKQR